MENLRTFESVFEFINESIARKEILPEEWWLQIAQSLNTFLEDEKDKLYLLEQKVAELKMVAIETGDTVAKANVRVQASMPYLEARRQRAKVERAIETIRISKLQARLTTDVINSK